MLINPVVFIIGTPRSCATVLLRCFDARHDCQTFNDLSLPVYITKQEPHLGQLFRLDSCNSYTEARALIAHAAQRKPVVLKETAVVAAAFFHSNPDWLRHSQIYCIYMSRNPYHAISSIEWITDRPVPDLEQKLGYRDLYELAKQTKHNLFIDARQLCSAPVYTLQLICRFLECQYISNMCYWQSRIGWHESKCLNQMQLWHGRVLRTRTIGIMLDSSTKIKPEHEEIAKRAMEFYTNLAGTGNREAGKDMSLA